jgi:uncharacterized protein DUF4331
MSHHYSGPNLAFPHGDARLNFTDLYVFPKPGNGSKSILIMNVHPSYGFNPKGPTTTVPFSTDALYEVMIDTNGDFIAEIAYSVRFSAASAGEQTATLRRITGTSIVRTGKDGVVILEGAPVSVGREAKVTNAGDYRFFAGWRSDPFFFDTLGALNGLKFTGADFFADKNVCSIALELPNSELGADKINLWARTLDGSTGSWIQADRGARSSQEPFLSGDQQSSYLASQPAQDAQFIPVFAHALQHTGGYTPEEATRVAAAQLPDVMPYQPAGPIAYPKNGRTLTDDVELYFLPMITNGKITGDGALPHTDLLAEFPYVGPPHNLTA